MKSKFYYRLTWVFVLSIMFTLIASSQTTIKVRVNASEDDAEEILADKVEPDGSGTLPMGDVDLGSSDLELGTEVAGAPQLIGMIFRDVQIPVGATILNAYVQFHVDDDNDDSITNTIFGALEANIDSSFKEELFNISNHPRTVDTVAWTPPPWLNIHEEGPDQQTPDISSIITEITSLEGWAPGNSLMIMITNPTLVKEHREAESFDGEEESAPQLVVTFTYTPTTTIEVRVNASEDDAEEILADKVEPDGSGTLPMGDVDLGSSDLELGTEVAGAPQLIGMIFRDVQIPVGATILNAYVQFHVDDDNDDSITNTIFGALEANIDSSFKEELFNISSHPKTVDTVAWTPPPWLNIHEEGPDQRTPDISSIITEIISLDGWAAGNSLMIMVTNPTLVKEHREAESFDGEAASAPKLVVEFDEIPKPIEILIADGNDDAEEVIKTTSSQFGRMDLGSSDLELGRDGSYPQAVGVRYILPVGHGATITDAYLQFSADEVSSGPLTLEIYAEAADNAAAFTEDSANVTSRAKTTAQVEWSPPDWETQHAVADSQKTVDISPVIQEVVSRYGFVKGNAIVIVLTPTDVSDTVGYRESGAFEDGGDPPPSLHLTYVGGAPSANASLAGLSIDVGTLDPVFDPATLDYTVLLPPGTAAVTVTAEATDSNATVVEEEALIDVSSLSAEATVVVTAEDGTTILTYTITMTVSTVGIEKVDPVSNIRFYHNSLTEELKVFNTSDVEMLEIYSITGKMLHSMKTHNQESLDISTGNLSHGVYLVRMKLSSDRIQTGKFVK